MKIVNHIEVRDDGFGERGFLAGRGNPKAHMVAALYIGTRDLEMVMEQYNLTAAEVYACVMFTTTIRKKSRHD